MILRTDKWASEAQMRDVIVCDKVYLSVVSASWLLCDNQSSLIDETDQFMTIEFFLESLASGREGGFRKGLTLHLLFSSACSSKLSVTVVHFEVAFSAAFQQYLPKLEIHGIFDPAVLCFCGFIVPIYWYVCEIYCIPDAYWWFVVYKRP